MKPLTRLQQEAIKLRKIRLIPKPAIEKSRFAREG
jgi:hypothetical protein